MAGNLEFITSASGTTVSALDLTDCFSADYDVYYLTSSLDIGTGAGFWQSNLLDSGGSTLTGAYYDVANLELQANTTFLEYRGTNETCNMYWYLYNLGNPNKYSFSTHQLSEFDKNAQLRMVFGGNVYTVAETINAIKVLGVTGTANISGTISLYGIAES